jgi:serpin B
MEIARRHMALQVDERGAEAAAATGVLIRTKCAAVRTLEFVADHPFLLVLVHRPDNVLFIGRFVTCD